MTEGPSAASLARPAEIIFEVTEAVQGGYDARVLSSVHVMARQQGREVPA